MTSWPGENFQVEEDETFSWTGYSFEFVLTEYAKRWDDNGKPLKVTKQQPEVDHKNIILLPNADFLPVYAFLGLDPETGYT